MTELRRIIDGEGDEFERQLLRSAVDDGPSARARGQVLVALGIGGSVVAGTTAAAAATATGVAAKGTTAALVKTGTGIVVAKWVGIATVGGLGTWGVVDQVREPEQVSQPVAAVAAPAATRAARVASARIAIATSESVDSPPNVDETEPVEPEPSATAEPVAPRPYGTLAPTAKGPSATGSEPSLAAEVKALDRAREAMKSDDPAGALKQLEAYQRKYSAGTLGQEAAVLRIEALAKAGKTARARAAAAAFLAQYPASPYAQRVRSVAAKAPKGSKPGATSAKPSPSTTKTGATSGTVP
jgi:hypothetical protein